MKKLAIISFLSYLLALAATQTVFGRGVMNLRWVGLAALAVTSGFCWLSRKSHWEGEKFDRCTNVLFLYLSLTLITVVAAENTFFSGFRWVSHALMLIVFLIFLRQNLSLRDATRIHMVLKILVSGLVLLSVLFPAKQTIYDKLDVFRGAMGNANTMGQIAAVAVLLYFHGFLVATDKRVRIGEIVSACIGAIIVWWSGSRSATIMLMVGLGLTLFYYRVRMQRKAVLSIIFCCLLMLVSPGLPQEVKRFIAKTDEIPKEFSNEIMRTRTDIWSGAWEAFKERPIFGWGFGADRSVPQTWDIRLTALGTVKRDSVNDFLLIMEWGGIAGLCGYFLLVYIVLSQKPTFSFRVFLQRFRGSRASFNHEILSVSHCHAIMFIVAASSLVMFQFDNTALSAGNFISVILWLSTACAGAIRKKTQILGWRLAAVSGRTRGKTESTIGKGAVSRIPGIGFGIRGRINRNSMNGSRSVYDSNK